MATTTGSSSTDTIGTGTSGTNTAGTMGMGGTDTSGAGSSMGTGGSAAGAGTSSPTDATTASGLAPGDHVFVTEIEGSNNSGVHGIAGFVLHGNTLTAEVAAEGLTPNQMHEMHIHEIPGGQSQLPTLAQDTNHDGLVEDPEAQSVIGPAALSLTSSGTVTNNESVSDFPTASADGTLNFHQTYTFNTSDTTEANILNELQSMGKGAFEIHGENVPESPGSSTLTFDPSIPVGGGLLHDVTGTATGDAAATAVLGSDPGSLLALNQVDPFGLGHA